MDDNEKYIKLAHKFEEYKNHEFKPFDKVLIYFRNRFDPNDFEIVPHIIWFKVDKEKYRLYDPTRIFYAYNIIPYEGNEEFVGFEGNRETLLKIKEAIYSNK